MTRTTMKPVAEHQELAALTGRWTQDVTYSMGGPVLKFVPPQTVESVTYRRAK